MSTTPLDPAKLEEERAVRSTAKHANNGARYLRQQKRIAAARAALPEKRAKIAPDKTPLDPARIHTHRGAATVNDAPPRKRIGLGKNTRGTLTASYQCPPCAGKKFIGLDPCSYCNATGKVSKEEWEAMQQPVSSAPPNA